MIILASHFDHFRRLTSAAAESAIADTAVNIDWNATALGGANAEYTLCIACFIVPR
jgi:hypothetical protein